MTLEYAKQYLRDELDMSLDNFEMKEAIRVILGQIEHLQREEHRADSVRQRFVGQNKICPETFERFGDRAENDFIYRSIKEIPIEKLKQLVNFEVINPFDKTIPKTPPEAEYRNMLMDQRVIELRMEIMI